MRIQESSSEVLQQAVPGVPTTVVIFGTEKAAGEVDLPKSGSKLRPQLDMPDCVAAVESWCASHKWLVRNADWHVISFCR